MFMDASAFDFGCSTPTRISDDHSFVHCGSSPSFCQISSPPDCSSIRWLNPLFRVGYKRRLEEEDLYDVLAEDRSERLGQDLHR